MEQVEFKCYLCHKDFVLGQIINKFVERTEHPPELKIYLIHGFCRKEFEERYGN